VAAVTVQWHSARRGLAEAWSTYKEQHARSPCEGFTHLPTHHLVHPIHPLRIPSSWQSDGGCLRIPPDQPPARHLKQFGGTEVEEQRGVCYVCFTTLVGCVGQRELLGTSGGLLRPATSIYVLRYLVPRKRNKNRRFSPQTSNISNSGSNSGNFKSIGHS